MPPQEKSGKKVFGQVPDGSDWREFRDFFRKMASEITGRPPDEEGTDEEWRASAAEWHEKIRAMRKEVDGADKAPPVPDDTH